MSQQYPQQPGWGAPQQPQWGTPPPPQKKRNVGKILGLGCASLVGFVVVITVIAAVASSGGSKTSSSGTTVSTSSTAKAAGGKTNGGGAKAGGSKAASDTVVFKVWGTAPSGALGGLDITYGSDSDTRKGTWKHGAFTAGLPLNDKALFFQVSAQLQGSGDINCSVTVGGKTKSGHASGGYNICDAQLSSGLFGDWG